MSTQTFRSAQHSDLDAIWNIIQGAIARRKADNSKQWQDGYPNPEVLEMDINSGNGYVLVENNEIVGYVALLINDEPAYDGIVGKWQTNSDFVVFHRVAISQSHLGKGYAKILFAYIEKFAVSNNIWSVKADTNFDNGAMIHLFESVGYVYCGEVFFRGNARKAYEKVLSPIN